MPERSRHISIDPEIIKGCRQGEAAAQQAFYEQFGKLVMSVCHRYAATDADAEDIFQESFIAIFEQVGSLKHPERIISWLYKVVISKVVRYYRKRVQVVEATEWNVNAAAGGHQENEAIQMLSAEEILFLVRQLPDGYRLIFNLYVMEGFSHKEIAQMVGINETTSRSQLFKAKQWLKKKIVETYGITSYEKRIG